MDKLLPGAEPGSSNARQAQKKLADFAIAMAPLKATADTSTTLNDGFMLTERQHVNHVLKNFDKLDRDGNRFLSETELESATSTKEGGNLSQADSDAAKYLSKNYYTIRSFYDDYPRYSDQDKRQDSFGLSRNDLSRFLDVTASNFDAGKTANQQIWDRDKGAFLTLPPICATFSGLLYKGLGKEGALVGLGSSLLVSAVFAGSHLYHRSNLRKELVETHKLSQRLKPA